MPIRFRCAYCNQLMGIARRKAGTVVRCPKCAGEIIVPVPEGAESSEDEPGKTAGGQAFDVEQFDPAAPEPVSTGPTTTAAAPQPVATATEAPVSPMPAPSATPQRVGVFVPLGMLIILIGVVVLLLILMFVIGLIIGRATMLPDANAKSAAAAALAGWLWM
jgi:hypothetical protein